jgi:diaminobutyrate-2-oxoglutarate transaminase
MHERLATIAARHAEHCAGVRGIGMIQGLVWRDGQLASAVSRAAFARGLIVETCGPDGAVTKLLPPLVIAADELEEGLAILSDAADEVAAQAPPRAAVTRGRQASSAP